MKRCLPRKQSIMWKKLNSCYLDCGKYPCESCVTSPFDFLRMFPRKSSFYSISLGWPLFIILLYTKREHCSDSVSRACELTALMTRTFNIIFPNNSRYILCSLELLTPWLSKSHCRWPLCFW